MPRAPWVSLSARISRPWYVVPMVSSFASCGLLRAAAYIWSRKPPGSSHERQTVNPFSDCSAANSLHGLAALDAGQRGLDAVTRELGALCLREHELDLGAAGDVPDAAELEPLVGQCAKLIGLHDRRVDVEPVAGALLRVAACAVHAKTNAAIAAASNFPRICPLPWGLERCQKPATSEPEVRRILSAAARPARAARPRRWRGRRRRSRRSPPTRSARRRARGRAGVATLVMPQDRELAAFNSSRSTRRGITSNSHRDRDQRDHRAQQRGRLPEDEQAQLAPPPQEVRVDGERAQDPREPPRHVPAAAYSISIARAWPSASVAAEPRRAGPRGSPPRSPRARARTGWRPRPGSPRRSRSRGQPRRRAVPGVLGDQRAALADDLDHAARRHVEAAVERAEHVAGEPQHAGEAHVDAVAARTASPLHALRLAAQQPQRAHAVAADVHQRAALERRPAGARSPGPRPASGSRTRRARRAAARSRPPAARAPRSAGGSAT